MIRHSRDSVMVLEDVLPVFELMLGCMDMTIGVFVQTQVRGKEGECKAFNLVLPWNDLIKHFSNLEQ